MLLLLPLALIALLLLIDPPNLPVREHLSATSTIKKLDEETTDTTELRRRAKIVPEPLKTELTQMYNSRPMPGKSLDEFIGWFVGITYLDDAFTKLYAPATKPLTEADIDAYVTNLKTTTKNSDLPDGAKDFRIGFIDNGNVKTLFKAYFLDQPAPVASIAMTPVPTPPSAAPPQVKPVQGPTQTLAELKREYDGKSTQYKQLIDEAVTTGNSGKMNQIRQLNLELSSLLEQMISTASPTRPEQDIQTLRNDLVNRLRRIQVDYNGLLQTTDELETLRRIRAQEEGGFFQVFYWHLLALASAFFLAVTFMIYMRRTTSAVTTSSPTMTADLE